MFPESVRKGTHSLVWGSLSGVRRFYGFGRAALWVLFSSTAILFAPVVFEVERLQMEEISRQQQRQVRRSRTLPIPGIQSSGAIWGLE